MKRFRQTRFYAMWCILCGRSVIYRSKLFGPVLYSNPPGCSIQSPSFINGTEVKRNPR